MTKPTNTEVQITQPVAAVAPCPSCGYCPTCGRKNVQTYPYPWYPYQPYQPWYTLPYTWTLSPTTWGSGSITTNLPATTMATTTVY